MYLLFFMLIRKSMVYIRVDGTIFEYACFLATNDAQTPHTFTHNSTLSCHLSSLSHIYPIIHLFTLLLSILYSNTNLKIAFFAMWWNDQTDQMKGIVKTLVNEGQLSFANGGWWYVLNMSCYSSFICLVDYDYVVLWHCYVKSNHVHTQGLPSSLISCSSFVC